MDQISDIKYLLPFLKKSGIRKISSAELIGSIKYDYDLVRKIGSTSVDKANIDLLIKEIDLLIEKRDFDIHIDDIINVYCIESNEKKYYVFIVNTLEFFYADYLVGVWPLYD